MFKISVIIPIYNAESTLRRAIDSILNQKWEIEGGGKLLEDIEIILVDDCSSDNTKHIIQEYSMRYPNIKYYSTEYNTGFPSKPRNIGIENSKGKYLMFLDSDDEYCEDMCQTLFKTIENENADIVVSRFYVNQKGIKNNISFDVDSFIEKNDYIILDSFNSIIFNEILTWNKIINRKKLIDSNILFKTQKPDLLLEDRFFFLEFYPKIDKCVFLKNYFGVIYHDLEDSYSSAPNKNNLINAFRAGVNLHELANYYVDFDKYPQYKFNFTKPLIMHVLGQLSHLTNNKDLHDCLKELHEFENKISFDNDIGVLKFLNWFILKNHLKIAIFLMNIIQILNKYKIVTKMMVIINRYQ